MFVSLCLTGFFLIQGTLLFARGQEIHAGYRKDYFYPYDHYPEINLPDPIHGGRFHLVTVSAASGSPGDITLNGQTVSFASGQDPDSWLVDWLHVYPTNLTKGQPVWISFHTRNTAFDTITSSTFELQTTDSQVAVNGKFAVVLNWCNITYVTTTTNYSSLLIHVHNGYTSTRTIQKVLLNDSDVTANVSNKQSLTVPPLSSTMLTVGLLAPVTPGNLYTVVLQYAESGAAESVAGGRVAKTHFPIEAWPKSKECPFPTVKDNNYKWHRDHGIDTLFFGEKSAQPCGSQTPGNVIAGELAPQYGFYCLTDINIPPQSIKNTSNVLATFLSDEPDNKLDDQVRKLMNESVQIWKEDSTFLTYIGGSRSRRSGIFAGLADIQGMDMYIAACAPHIQEFLHPPPLRGSYDYLRLTRNNHMPLPTWLYSQLLDDGWDAKIGDRVISHREPEPYEYRVQAMSVIAGCGKGLMYFQSEISENEYYPQTWVECSNFNKDIGAVREYLRQGDCTDMVTNSDGDGWDTESLAQAIRAPEAIFVTVINLKNDGGYNDLGCEIGENLHWKMNPHTVDQVIVTIPPDFGSVVDKFEVQNGKILNINSVNHSSVVVGKSYYGDDIEAQQVSINGIHMTTDLATRLFVLASSTDVRENIKNRLK